ncbi:hypothetical protein M1I87_002607, partial [Serratia marcescens]
RASFLRSLLFMWISPLVSFGGVVAGADLRLETVTASSLPATPVHFSAHQPEHSPHPKANFTLVRPNQSQSGLLKSIANLPFGWSASCCG